MKLVRIEHIRCGDCEGYTYMLAPDEITKEKFDDDVWKAANGYLNAKENFKQLGKRPEYLNYNLDNMPGNMTVFEAKEAVRQRNEEIKEWDKAERKCTRSFGFWMQDLGYKFLGDAEDNEILDSFVNWGHRHGEHIEYDMTETDIQLQKKEVRVRSIPIKIRKSEPLTIDKILRKVGLKK